MLVTHKNTIMERGVSMTTISGNTTTISINGNDNVDRNNKTNLFISFRKKLSSDEDSNKKYYSSTMPKNSTAKPGEENYFSLRRLRQVRIFSGDRC